jgi:hypothetical protein
LLADDASVERVLEAVLQAWRAWLPMFEESESPRMPQDRFSGGVVIEIQRGRDISEDPAMQELAQLYNDMTSEEQDRTIDYLTGALPPGKSKQKPEAESQLKKGGKNVMTELLTSREAAAFLKVSVITLAKWRGTKRTRVYPHRPDHKVYSAGSGRLPEKERCRNIIRPGGKRRAR